MLTKHFLPTVLLASLLASSCHQSYTQERKADLRVGSLVLLEGYKHKGMQGTDSIPGEISDSAGKLFIYYEIGLMSGTLVSKSKRREYSWYREQKVNGFPGYFGLLKKGQNQTLQVTVLRGTEPETFAPANFTAFISKPGDLKDALLMIGSFTWKPVKK